MYILGISCLYHNSAAALIKDGIVVVAAEEERFSRKKGDAGFPHLAIQFCLDAEKITVNDLDFVVFYEKPFEKFERLLHSLIQTIPYSLKAFQSSMLSWFKDKLWLKAYILERLNIPKSKLLFSEHHISHAASSFFCSPFHDAAILTMDGVGEWATGTLGRASSNGRHALDISYELRFPHSLGMLYSAFTAFLGFEVNEGEYKVMGMAPYGKPQYVDKVLRLLELKDDGSFQLDMSYFSYHYHMEKMFKRKFEKLFGAPRSPKARFVTAQTSTYDDPVPPTAQELAQNQYYADIAASIQSVTEMIMLNAANYLYKITGSKNLCIAGGVGLNSVANYKLLTQTPFEDIFVQPASGDAGGAIGAALYVYHCILQKPRQYTMKHAYYGQSYAEPEIAAAIKDAGLKCEMTDEGRILDRAVDYITQGKIVGWFQGRFEWGPRALGNRSILADARNPKMKDIVNIKIKFREPFRPFAPSVLAEKAGTYFDIPSKGTLNPLRFMLMVTPVRENQREEIPATTHVDGTGRLQTVHADTNPLYHRLIERFSQATGVPVILNTSFNLKGEPIVNTPGDAISTYLRSGIDALVLNNFIVAKDSVGT